MIHKGLLSLTDMKTNMPKHWIWASVKPIFIGQKGRSSGQDCCCQMDLFTKTAEVATYFKLTATVKAECNS